MFKKEIYLFLFVFLLQSTAVAQSSQHRTGLKLSGQIIDAKTSKGVSFAAIIIEETGRGVYCDANGFFHFPPLKKGNYTLKTSCLGYAPEKLLISLQKDTSLIIRTKVQSIALKEFSVMATYSPKKGSNVVIDQAAIEYIQPTSLQDIFLLLPGNIITGNSLHRFGLISSRQAGSDANTSLGMGIVADGIPISNDASRTQIFGETGASKSTVNAGVDSRNISTDHIESVEVVRGISSAKQGNLSSGAIHIVSKRGVSPWQIRTKSDPLTKLLYVGKGFLLSEKKGTIHIGADILGSDVDVRDRLTSFTRATGQINYNNKLSFIGKPLDINAKFSQTITTNSQRTDQLVEENDQFYKSDYTRSALSLKTQWSIESPFIEMIETLLSADYSSDFLTRRLLFLSTSGPSSMPLAQTEGENEGIFLPAMYYSNYSVDNRPFYLFAQLNGQSTINITPSLLSQLLYGAEWRLMKNFGEGAIVDPTRPPFPNQNSFIRPRPNHAIPALISNAFYLESKTQYKFRDNELNLSAGLRTTQMFNLPKEYALSRKILLEPRIQFQWMVKSQISETKILTNNFRIGYGEENKMPTLDHLYPDKVYRDFVVMNAYFQDPARDRLITFTRIHDMTNPELKENKNKKIELGWDVMYSGWEWSGSVFHENSADGFEYFYNFYPIAFDRYLTAKHPISGRPEKDDYIKEEHKDFTQFSRPTNSSKVIKRGFEYRLRAPRIKAIYTSIELNGAYYKTVYTSNVPVMFHPPQQLHGKNNPYVGIYEGSAHYHRSRLNTNLWLNTHVPKFKLIFTNFIQVLWFTNSYTGNEESGFPSHYMDLDGEIHPVSEAEVRSATDGLQYLMRIRSELYYRKTIEPVSLRWNFKMTKELGRRAKISLFVDNIIDINPKYKKANKTTDRNWNRNFFGLELMLNL